MALGTCPNGWIASPHSNACYYSPPVLSTHIQCATVCNSSQPAALGCLGSANTLEVAFLLATIVVPTSQHWVGRYRDDSNAWVCVDDNGLDECTDLPGLSCTSDVPEHERCAVLAKDGRLQEWPCTEARFRCLCELGATSSNAYRESMADLMPPPPNWRALALLGAIAWLPLLIALAAYAASRVERWLVSPRDTADAAVEEEEEKEAKVGSVGIFSRLVHSVKVAHQVRWQVTGVCIQLGWALMTIGLAPMFTHFLLVQDPLASSFGHAGYINALPFGVPGMVFMQVCRPTIAV